MLTPKEKTLLAMYRSVDRMNKHLLKDNREGITAERHLQINLRNDFEHLSVESD